MPVSPFTKTEVDPSFSKEERFLNETLERAMRPPQWQQPQDLFLPPRFGYDRTEPGWAEIMSLDRNYQDRRMDYSGYRSHYSGTARPSIGYV